MSAFLQKLMLPLALVTAMWFHANRLAAQCTVTGQIIDLSYSGNCGLVILEYQNYTLLIPSDTALGLSDGMEINFSYVASAQGSSCSVGTTVDITCFDIISSPVADCNASFSYVAATGSNFEILFQPQLLDNNLNYAWDFGDGSSSNLPSVYHTFQPGSYEVCLTMEGGACYQSTSCQTLDLQSCTASFVHAAIADGSVAFENTATGDFTNWQWETGDGTTLLNEPLAEHNYGTVDIFTACLTVWNNNGCFSKYCDYVFSGTGDICEFTDCVLPGDTDADGLASVYDLLPLGIGYGAEGPDRAGDFLANISWSPQFAPDWGVATATGVDYKHLDCNGDGQINEFDADIIGLNYQKPGNYLLAETDGAPYFWLDFDWDTVVVEDDSPPFIELEADLVASTSQIPFDNLRGFALQLEYPAGLVAENGVEANYNSNSFFGNSNGVLWLGQNRPGDARYDLGFARKTGSGGGFGDVVKLKFIVIADVIARNTSATPFTVAINDVVAVNPDGEMMALGPVNGEATVVILNKMTTGATEKWLDSKATLYPNPTNGAFNVVLKDVMGEKLEVYNTMGQKVHEQTLSTSQVSIMASQWGPGVYFIKIHTPQGIINKKLVVQ